MAKFDADLNVPYGPEKKPWKKTLSILAQTKNEGGLHVSPPTKDPKIFEDTVTPSGISPHLYQVPSTGLTQNQQDIAHKEAWEFFQSRANNSLGFQANLQHKQYAVLIPYIDADFHINNGEDLFKAGGYIFNTKWIERNILDYYASLWRAKWPHDASDMESYWGYVLNMGSTEGNIHAIWSARDYLSGMPITNDVSLSQNDLLQPFCSDDNPNCFSPVAFYSDSSHHGMKRNLQMIGVPSFYDVGIRQYPNDNPLGGPWPTRVPTTTGPVGISSGSVDIDALTKLVDFFTGKGHPILVIFNYGTTFEGAYDDVKTAGEVLIPILKKNKMYSRKIYYDRENLDQYSERKGFWFHVDGALGAAYMPFVEMGYDHGLIKEKPGPVFDFRLDFISSIVTSGHKWMGTPWPCGIFMTKTGLLMKPQESFKPFQATASGSRNGLSSVMLWTYISTSSYEKEVETIAGCLQLVEYAVKRLKDLEKDLSIDLCIQHSSLSLAVLFKKPDDKLVEKYNLDCRVIRVNGKECLYCHIYIMPSVTKDMIDQLIHDLKKRNSCYFL